MNAARHAFSIGLAAIASLVAAGGCTDAAPGIAGFACASDGDCNAGLRCLPYEDLKEGGADAGCTSMGLACLIACKSNAECTAAGPGLVCFNSCGTSACEPQQ
jgi:hypothetical protein